MTDILPIDDDTADRVILPSLETPTLTKAELAELLFERLGLNKRESKDMVEAFFELVHETLVSGQDVKLSGFGKFDVRKKNDEQRSEADYQRAVTALGGGDETTAYSALKSAVAANPRHAAAAARLAQLLASQGSDPKERVAYAQKTTAKARPSSCSRSL